MKNFLLSFFALSVLVVPVFAFAADTYNENTGIVPCSNTPDENGVIADPCDFNAFMTLINNGISAIMFAYAGFLMVTAGESASEARTKAKGIFLDALLGLVIALSCWVVVHSIFEVFGYKGGWIGL
jgi:hypothetical protein